MSNAVRVLIATVATGERATYVMRALASLRIQAPVEARPIVIVNGDGADAGLVSEIGRFPGVMLVRRAEPNLPRALAAGRRLVDTAFFAQLDDDDELLPGALAMRLARIREPDQPDAVVTNGIIRSAARETFSIPDTAAVERDPLGTLMDCNWMLPGSALFRSATVSDAVFESTPRFLEWTYIALLLASRYRMAFLPAPTVVHYEGLPFSVDRSPGCTLGRPAAFDAALRLELPAAVKRRLRAKRSAAWHAAAEAWRLDGNLRRAWAAHLHSVAGPGGWRYVAYGRHLFGRSGTARGAGGPAGSATVKHS